MPLKLPRICLILAVLACFAPQLKAQQHALLPGEDETELAKERLFCLPGVENSRKGRGILLEYGSVGGYNIAPAKGLTDAFQNSSISHVEQVVAKVKIPLWNAPSLKMLLGYEYGSETFHFDQIGSFHRDVLSQLDNKTLRTNHFSFYITKSFNEKFYGGLRLRASYRGDYSEGIKIGDPRYATYSGLAVFGVKPRPDLEWGVGLSYSDNFFRKRVLPFAIYNQTFNDKWGIEAVLPVQVMARYNVSPESMLFFGSEYQSKSYAFDVKDDFSEALNPYFFRHSELVTKVAYDQHLFSWVWLSVEGGFLLPMRFRFDDATAAANSFQADTDTHPYFKVGIFVSPSKACMKR